MRCPDCGKRNPDSRKFCQECGKDLEKVRLRAQNIEYVCHTCGTKGTKADKFCGSCGAEMPILLPWLDEEEEAHMREKIAEYRNILVSVESTDDVLRYEEKYDRLDAELSEIKLDMDKYVPRFDRRWRAAAEKIRGKKRQLKSRGTVIASDGSGFKALILLLLTLIGIPAITATASVVVNMYLSDVASAWLTVGIIAFGCAGFAAALHCLGVKRLVKINAIISAIGAVIAIVFSFIPILQIVGIAIFAAIFASSIALFVMQLYQKEAVDAEYDDSFPEVFYSPTARERLSTKDARLSVNLAAFALMFTLWAIVSYALVNYGKGLFLYLAFTAAFVFSLAAFFLIGSFSLSWKAPLSIVMLVLNALAILVFSVIISGPAIFAFGITCGLSFYIFCLYAQS